MNDRVRVEGVVLSQQQTTLSLVHLRTAQGAMQIEMVKGDCAGGDRLAVVGYPMLSNKHVVLRNLGHGAAPVPVNLDVAALLRAGGDSDLVEIQRTIFRSQGQGEAKVMRACCSALAGHHPFSVESAHVRASTEENSGTRR